MSAPMEDRVASAAGRPSDDLPGLPHEHSSQHATRLLKSDEWKALREIRLKALEDSPAAFLAKHETEKKYGEETWRAEFARGEWTVGELPARPAGPGQPVSLVGVTRDPDTDRDFLGYMWVAPQYRGAGLARDLVHAVLWRLRSSGSSMAFLWVLDGNEAAMTAYEKLGFRYADVSQPLPRDAQGRSEHLMQIELGGWARQFHACADREGARQVGP